MVIAYTFVMSYIGYKLIDRFIPMRVSRRSEKIGLDISQHNEHYGLADVDDREIAEYAEYEQEKKQK